MKLSKRKVILSVLLLLVGGSIVIWSIAQSTDKRMRTELLQQARIAAQAISVDSISSLSASEKDLETIAYQRIKSQLASMRMARHKARFLYLMGRSLDSNIYFFVDSLDPTSEQYALPGLIYDEVPESYLSVFNTRIEAVTGPVTDRWGTLVTALIPIISPDSGRLLAVLGMDIEADEWNREIIKRCIGPSLVILLMLILIFLLTSRENILVELKGNEEKLRNIVENATNLFYSHTVNHELTYISPRCRDFLQCEPKEAMIKWNKFATDNPINNMGLQLTQKAIDTGECQNPYELELIGQKGKKIRVEVNETPVFSNNKVVGIVGALTDITERKRAEEKLIESENRYRSFAENFQGIAFYGKLDFTPIFFHGAVEDITGYTEDEFIAGQPRWDQVIYPDDRDSILSEHVKELCAIPEYSSEREYRIVRKDGQIRWVNEIIKNICDNAGQPVMVQGAIYDITDRNISEKLLRESEAKYRTYIDSSPVGIFNTDRSGRYMDANKAACEMLGYTKQELLSFSISDIDKTVSDASATDDFQKLKDTGFLHSERKLLKKDGSFLEVDLRAVPIGEDTYIAFCSDLTGKKKLETQLRQTQKLEAIGTLAGGIAHDFNNILSSIIGFTELAIDDSEKGSRVEDSLQEIYIAGKRARDLVKQILAFARQSNLEKKPMQLDKIAREALNLIRATLPTTIEIREQFESASLIMGNVTEIHQIFMNLCTNAAQSMEKHGGILEIQLKDVDIDQNSTFGQSSLPLGNYIKLSVSDTGEGISQNIIESIFEPYFTTKEVGKGSGMGLAMIHSIVEAYGGKVFVESELGKGTVFTIYLPITKQHATYKSYEIEDLPTGTERILFVDDELSIIKMGKQILERLGYTVSVRAASLEALELFRAKPTEFDLVISDMTMPGLTGDMFATELLNIRPDIPIILCTGYSNKITHETASALGIKAFTYKPIIKADLAKTVRKVLDEAKGPVQ